MQYGLVALQEKRNIYYTGQCITNRKCTENKMIVSFFLKQNKYNANNLLHVNHVKGVTLHWPQVLSVQMQETNAKGTFWYHPCHDV